MGWWEISGSWWVVVQSLNTRYIVLDRSRRRLQVVVCCGVRFVGEWGEGVLGVWPTFGWGRGGSNICIGVLPTSRRTFQEKRGGWKILRKHTMFEQ